VWIFFAFASAVFAGMTAILSKIGIRNTDSNVATAIRTVIVLIFSWLMVLAAGSFSSVTEISGRTFLFLVLSGFSTGASWLCYFKALQLGSVNKVTPIDKSSTILSMLLAVIFLGESITLIKTAAILAIGAGTFLMIQKQKEAGESEQANHRWMVYAALAAVFAGLTSILGKIGIEGVESNLGTAIRTIVVLIMAWLIVFLTGKQSLVRRIDRRSWRFLILSGLSTGGSWLCYYRALQDGPASVVVPIDKLSILVTILFSSVFLKETLTKRAVLGLVLIVTGTLSLLMK
jgi:transporter family protein